MPVDLRPNTELVAVAWLGGVVGLSPSMVATTLPDATKPDGTPADWRTTGFVQCFTVGGSPEKHNPLRRPVVSVDCWAVMGSTVMKPNFALANHLAELVWLEVMNPRLASRRVTPVVGGKTYPTAQVLTVDMLTEPRRVPADPAGYAHYQFDMEIAWGAI